MQFFRKNDIKGYGLLLSDPELHLNLEDSENPFDLVVQAPCKPLVFQQVAVCHEKTICRLNFKLVIKSFSCFTGHETNWSSPPEFSSEDDGCCRWKLCVYPRGRGDLDSTVDICLKLVKTDMIRTLAKFKICLVNANDALSITSDNTDEWTVFKEGKMSRGCQFIYRDKVLDKSKGWLTDDTLTVTCYIEYAREAVIKSTEL